MGLMDSARQKAKEFAAKNPDKVEQVSDQVIEKTGDAVDAKTDNKYAAQVDQAQEALDRKIGE